MKERERANERGEGGKEIAREYKQEKRTLNMCIKSLLHVYVEY